MRRDYHHKLRKQASVPWRPAMVEAQDLPTRVKLGVAESLVNRTAESSRRKGDESAIDDSCERMPRPSGSNIAQPPGSGYFLVAVITGRRIYRSRGCRMLLHVLAVVALRVGGYDLKCPLPKARYFICEGLRLV